jgi:hypothetical protein
LTKNIHYLQPNNLFLYMKFWVYYRSAYPLEEGKGGDKYFEGGGSKGGSRNFEGLEVRGERENMGLNGLGEREGGQS